MGFREHGGNHPILERESFDSVDDPARSLQLVLRDLLCLSAIEDEEFPVLAASKHGKQGFGQTD